MRIIAAFVAATSVLGSQCFAETPTGSEQATSSAAAVNPSLSERRLYLSTSEISAIQYRERCVSSDNTPISQDVYGGN